MVGLACVCVCVRARARARMCVRVCVCVCVCGTLGGGLVLTVLGAPEYECIDLQHVLYLPWKLSPHTHTHARAFSIYLGSSPRAFTVLFRTQHKNPPRDYKRPDTIPIVTGVFHPRYTLLHCTSLHATLSYH